MKHCVLLLIFGLLTLGAHAQYQEYITDYSKQIVYKLEVGFPSGATRRYSCMTAILARRLQVKFGNASRIDKQNSRTLRAKVANLKNAFQVQPGIRYNEEALNLTKVINGRCLPQADFQRLQANFNSMDELRLDSSYKSLKKIKSLIKKTIPILQKAKRIYIPPLSQLHFHFTTFRELFVRTYRIDGRTSWSEFKRGYAAGCLLGEILDEDSHITYDAVTKFSAPLQVYILKNATAEIQEEGQAYFDHVRYLDTCHFLPVGAGFDSLQDISKFLQNLQTKVDAEDKESWQPYFDFHFGALKECTSRCYLFETDEGLKVEREQYLEV